MIVGEARNSDEQTVRSRLRAPEGYTLTALTAFDAAKRLAAGEVETSGTEVRPAPHGVTKARDADVAWLRFGRLRSEIWGRKRWHDTDALIADIVAKRLVRFRAPATS